MGSSPDIDTFIPDSGQACLELNQQHLAGFSMVR
jgi:hypothetical protein